MTKAAAIDLFCRAVASEAELKALIASRPNDRHRGPWLDMLPFATELVAAAREAVERAA